MFFIDLSRIQVNVIIAFLAPAFKIYRNWSLDSYFQNKNFNCSSISDFYYFQLSSSRTCWHHAASGSGSQSSQKQINTHESTDLMVIFR